MTTTMGTISVLQTFLNSRYDAVNKMLNLQSMYSDQFLANNGLLSQDSTRSKMFPALMKVASMDMPQVESVNLASNNVTDVSQVTTLAQTYPHLKNLSLQDNGLVDWRQLDAWRHKFRELRELVLTGNAVTSLPNYRAEILRRFPSLKMLDGIPVETTAAVGGGGSGGGGSALNSISNNNSRSNVMLNLTQKLAVSTRSGFFETPEVQGIATDFLGKFLQVYDGDRGQLRPLYDDMSMFSMTLNTAVPRELEAGGFGGIGAGPGQQNWSAYIALSRNMTRVSRSNLRQNRLALGQEQIMQLLQKLPATRHDLAAPEKFAVEAWTVRGVRTAEDSGILLIVHGEFEEGTATQTQQQQILRRSFDRTMLLLPFPGTGSILVASDMLTVRGWAGARAWASR
ncbi:uncharacterized protein V1518DRAFT_418582 [Limtongia smithiae]|uniref:uncharacterized protein n=1 Tax=Limtongia smithiae TaxID=1125753 RepID=UPI0034CE0289